MASSRTLQETIKKIENTEMSAFKLKYALLCMQYTLLIIRKSKPTCLTFGEDQIYKEIDEKMKEIEELLSSINDMKEMIDEEQSF
ncbi:hypothetical protein KY289_007229 [Solanum tuberosum]|nr:hypothetical protein KY289_007229 [Solanum tuberosum]